MGGLFGGGSKKSSSSPTRQTTADSIETKDGTVYDKRATAATDQKTATDNIVDPLGGSKKTDATLSTDPLDAMMSRQKKSKTIAGAPNVGFG